MEISRGVCAAQEIVGLHESVRAEELGDFFPVPWRQPERLSQHSHWRTRIVYPVG